GSLNNLGDTAQVRGDVAAARRYYERALAIEEKQNPDAIGVAYSLNGLAELLDEMGAPRGAIANLRRALQIIDRRDPDDRLAPEVLRTLARLLAESGNGAEAAACLKRAVRIEERQQALQGSAGEAGRPAPTRPEVRFLGPGQNSAVEGDEVAL